jgi:hypothetical protein
MLLAGPALAQPPVTAKQRRAANELTVKGIARSDAGDYSAAINLYLQAYAIAPDSVLLSNIGAAFQKSGNPTEALRYFCMYLQKEPSGDNAPYVTSQIKSLQLQLGNKTVDDSDVCAAPKPKPEPVAKPVPAPIDPPVVVITRAEHGPAEPSEARGPGKLAYVGLASGVVGLAAVGFGLYEGVQAQHITDQINNQPTGMPWPEDIQDTQRRGQDYENRQIGFLIGGGVLVTTGAILFYLGHSDRSAPRSTTAIRVSPTTNGFTVAGEF